MDFNSLLPIVQMFSLPFVLTMLILYFAMQKFLVYTSCISKSYPLWLHEHVSCLGRTSSPEVIQILF